MPFSGTQPTGTQPTGTQPTGTTATTGTAQQGVTVVDPASPLRQTWYFDGRFLRADDFRTDQDYGRALAALLGQASGSGVVHGLEVGLGTGDQLQIEAGLALAPSGRPVLLTRQVTLATADLISRSRSALPSQVALDPATGDAFGRCRPLTGTGGTATLDETVLYLLTVASADALCGQEERFGQLCADACATETDSSQLVEGVVFRVHVIAPVLPVPRTVSVSAVHLRSQVASALFAADRRATPAVITGTGLGSSVWCQGAEGIGGEEVALGVFHRSGSVTSWFDGWAVRRELHEPTPRRYWASRTAMRPWAGFLAEVLQLQCQLTTTAVASASTASGSTLVDAGILELPAAGYLRVDPAKDVEAQVRTLVGPGVDVRFGIGRADVAAGLLEQAQHLERINLTHGLDDPGERQQIDVLVPDGEIAAATGTDSALVGSVLILPGRRGTEDGAVLALTTLAVDAGATGWSWSAAGIGELPVAAGLRTLLRAAGMAPGRSRRPSATTAAKAWQDLVTPIADQHRRLAGPTLVQRVRRLAAQAAGRAAPVPDGPEDGFATIAGWVQATTTDRVDALQPGAGTVLQARLAMTSDLTDISTADIQVTGALRVTDRRVEQVNDAPVTVIDTLLSGFADIFTVDDGAPNQRVSPLRNLFLQWRFGLDEEQRRVVTLSLSQDPQSPPGIVAQAISGGDPRVVTGLVFRANGDLRAADDAVPTGAMGTAAGTGAAQDTWTAGMPSGWDAAAGAAGAGSVGVDRRLSAFAGFEVRDTAGALGASAPSRQIAEATVDLIAEELAARQRDPAFRVTARQALFGTSGPATPAQVRATRDWVLFHRRHEVTHPSAAVAVPQRIRVYRLYDVELTEPGQAEVLSERLRSGGDLGNFALTMVDDVAFAEGSGQLESSVDRLRSQWRQGAHAPVMSFAAASGAGDGLFVAYGRVNAVRSALAGLTDSSAVNQIVLDQVPPELAADGVDGVLVTAGLRTQCVQLIRLTDRQWKIVREGLAGLTAEAGTLEEAVRKVLGAVRLDSVRGTVIGDAITNPGALTTWWGTSKFIRASTLLPVDRGDGSDTVDARTARARAAMLVLDAEASESFEAPVTISRCGVAVLIAVSG